MDFPPFVTLLLTWSSMRGCTGAQNDQTPVEKACTTKPRNDSARNQDARRARSGANNGTDFEDRNAPSENPLDFVSIPCFVLGGEALFTLLRKRK